MLLYFLFHVQGIGVVVLLNIKKKQAYIIYSEFKKTKLNRFITYNVIDSLISNVRQPYGYYSIGKKLNDELIVSKNLSKIPSISSLIKAVLFWNKDDFKCLLYVIELYNNDILPKIGSNKLYWAIRTFFIAKVFKFEYRWMAKNYDEVFVVSYYSAIMLGIIWSFRSLKKNAWDVQHGYIGPQHPAYGIAQLMNEEVLCRPNGFVVWNDYTENYLKKINNSIKIINTNYLHLRKNSSDNSTHSRKDILLYTLNWALDVPEEILDAAIRIKEVNWVFRRHPYDSEKYTIKHDFSQLSKYTHIRIEGSDVPLADHLERSILHLTFDSTVTIEAEVFGVPTFFHAPKAQCRFSNIHSARFVALKDMEKTIEKFLKTRVNNAQ